MVSSDKVDLSQTKLMPAQTLNVTGSATREMIVVRGAVTAGEGDNAKLVKEGERLSLANVTKLANKTGKPVEILFLNVVAPAAVADDKVLTLKNYA